MLKNPQFHGRSKHIDIKHDFVRDEVKKGTVDVKYCRTDSMIADELMNELYAERLVKLRHDWSQRNEFGITNVRSDRS